MKGKYRAGLLVLGFALSAVAISGCGTSPVRSSADAPAGLTATEATVLTVAREKTIQSCMRRRSQSYLLFLQNDFTDQLFPLVLTNVQWAEKYGFGSGNRTALSDPNQTRLARSGKQENTRFSQALSGASGSPALQVTLPGGSVIGESAAGCYTYAQQHVYGNAAHWFGAATLASLGQTMAIDRAVDTAPYQSAAVAWSGCMKHHGLNYASPQAAEAAAITDGQALPQTRISIAAAEATCATQTSIARVSAAIYQQEVKKLPQIYQTALSVEVKLELSALPRATAIATGKQE